MKGITVKVLTVVFALTIVIGSWIGVINSVTHAVDTEIRNELAIQQMENTDYSSALYEEYRNLSNSRSTRVIAAVIVTVICGGVCIAVLRTPLNKDEESEDTTE